MQSGNALVGQVLDDGNLGEAKITGEVVGRRVQFLKRYLTSSPTPIHYIGTISEDANSMQGQWKIGGWGTGLWEAHRSNEDLTAELHNHLAKQIFLSANR